VLVDSRVRVTGEVEELLASHRLLTGPRRDPASLPTGQRVVSASSTDVQSTLVVRTEGPILDPAWTVGALTLEDVVLAYLSPAEIGRPTLEVAR
jgi:ABC-2 type transport system ATP-binding protein